MIILMGDVFETKKLMNKQDLVHKIKLDKCSVFCFTSKSEIVSKFIKVSIDCTNFLLTLFQLMDKLLEKLTFIIGISCASQSPSGLLLEILV